MDVGDWVKVGVELAGMGVMGLCFIFAVKGQVEVLAIKYDYHTIAIDKMQAELSKIAQIISDQRLSDERAINMDKRLANAEQDIRLLQQGEGFVLPIRRAPTEHGPIG